MYPDYPVHFDPNDQNLDFDPEPISSQPLNPNSEANSNGSPPQNYTEYGIEYGSPPNSPSKQKQQNGKFKFNAPKELYTVSEMAYLVRNCCAVAFFDENWL